MLEYSVVSRFGALPQSEDSSPSAVTLQHRLQPETCLPKTLLQAYLNFTEALFYRCSQGLLKSSGAFCRHTLMGSHFATF